MATYLICKINKRFNGSDVRWKAIPRMYPSVAETFQKIGTGLRQSQESQFVITISKSIVRAEGTQETDHSKF